MDFAWKSVSAKIYYADWFLPSRDELNAMYTNLHLFSVGGFDNEHYWSSSEATSTNARYQDFADGTQYDGSKAYAFINVRACRTFITTDIYSLRDEGEAGGLIFHITEWGESYKYFEAAPSDQSTSYVWSNVDTTELGTTLLYIGDGQWNTNEIIAQTGHTNSAAKLCADYQF